MTRQTRIFHLLIFLAAAAFFLVFYRFTLNYFFFQDDFFHLNISNADSFADFVGFFKLRDDIVGYRPVTIQAYFFTVKSLFGQNSAAFRTINMSLLLISFVLIIKIISKITRNKLVAHLTAAFWLLSSVHFMGITWISASYNIIGTLFWLTTSYFFLKYLQRRKSIFYIFSIISFLVTLGSSEFSVTWAPIFVTYCLFIKKQSLKKVLKIFSPFLILSSVYIFAKIFLTKIPQISEYEIAFNIQSLKSLFWYFLWSINIPEEFKKQVVSNLIIFNSKFFYEYKELIFKSFIGALLIVLLGVIFPMVRLIKEKRRVELPIISFAAIWFLVGILPVLIFPNHFFIMYLTLPSIGIYLLIAYLSSTIGSRFLVLLVLLIWLFTSSTTITFYRENSWMVEAQRFSKEFSQKMKTEFPVLQSGSAILFPLTDHRHLQALSENNAIRAIYDDTTLSIYYNKKILFTDLNRRLISPVYIYLPQ